LHLRCSLCFLESAAAQGMWALPTPGKGMIPLHPAHFLTASNGAGFRSVFLWLERNRM